MSEISKEYLVKLVRDRVSENLANPQVEYKSIEDPAERIKFLRGKLIEEAVEYLLDPCLDELGDIMEVVQALAKHDLGDDKGLFAVVGAKNHKREQRGGFDEFIGMYAFTSGKYGDS